MMSTLAEKLKNKKIIVLCLVVIIAIQCSISIYTGMHKNGYHEDEIATYQLANDVQGYMGWNHDALNTWLSGSYYQEMMSVTADERFDFLIPYVNQEKDVHPFLYYFAVHLVCSFFPETGWKWIGILINLCFCVITSIFLFKLSKAIMKSNVMALICVIAWSWSVGAAGTVVFLRMYAMLGMWCVIFALLLTRLVQDVANGEAVKKRCWVGLLLITAAGTLTQYYFLIFCLISCLCVLIYLLVKRAWKKSLFFAIAEAGGVVLAYACFPTIMEHIFNGYRGEQAFENFASSEHFFDDLRVVAVKITNELFNGWVKEIILICVIVVILYWLFCIFHPKLSFKAGAVKLTASPGLPKQFSIALYMDRGGIIAILAIVCICYFVIVCRIAPYQSDRYYMCIYPILLLVAVFLLYTLSNYIITKKKVVYILSLVIVLFVTVISYADQTVPYLYENRSGRMETLSEYRDFPVIVVNLATHNAALNPWVYEFAQFSDVYQCSCGSFNGVENAVETKDLSNGFLVYAQSSNLSDEEFIKNLSEFIDISDWEVVTNVDTKVYFCETAN